MTRTLLYTLRYFTHIFHHTQMKKKTIQKCNMSKNRCLKLIPILENSYIIRTVVVFIIFFFIYIYA